MDTEDHYTAISLKSKMSYFSPLTTPSEWVATPIDITAEKAKIIILGVLRSGVTDIKIVENHVFFTLKYTNSRENLIKKFNVFTKNLSITSG